MGLSGEVGRAEFVPLFTTAAHPAGGYLGRRFRLPEEAAAAKADALRAASEITDRYDRWMAKHEIRRRGPHASVAAWDCTFSPPKSVSLSWAAADRGVQQQVWAAHLAAVDAGLGYLQEHVHRRRLHRQAHRQSLSKLFITTRSIRHQTEAGPQSAPRLNSGPRPSEDVQARTVRALMILCEDHERRRNCSLDLVDVTTRDRHRVQQPAAGAWMGVNGPDVPGDIPPWTATAPDGRILAGIALPEEPERAESHLVAIPPEGDSVAVSITSTGGRDQPHGTSEANTSC